MKRIALAITALLIAFSFSLAKAPGSVIATGSGTWLVIPATVTSSDVNVDAAALSAPSWLQQLSEGVATTAPAKICYPFRGGQFHWVPQIMQLTGNLWTSITTTKEYLFGEEAGLYACAAPVNSGTFALFGYYNGPVEQAKVLQCTGALSVDEWSHTATPRSESTAIDVSNIKAVGINWTSCPEATKLGWGLRMCWNGTCHEYDEHSLAVSALTYPNPQDLTETIFGSSSMLIYPQGSSVCEFKPFVRLEDAGGNVLDVIYDLEFPDMCVS
jgi:hypothetical protein